MKVKEVLKDLALMTKEGEELKVSTNGTGDKEKGERPIE